MKEDLNVAKRSRSEEETNESIRSEAEAESKKRRY